VHAYGYDTANSWLLKDGYKANKVIRFGSEFHLVIHVVLAAKDLQN